MIVPTYKCSYCQKEITAEMDFSGDMLSGTLPVCDCKENRDAWERQHRAQMELRKKANRDSSVRSRSIVHVGRTPSPMGRKKHR